MFRKPTIRIALVTMYCAIRCLIQSGQFTCLCCAFYINTVSKDLFNQLSIPNGALFDTAIIANPPFSLLYMDYWVWAMRYLEVAGSVEFEVPFPLFYCLLQFSLWSYRQWHQISGAATIDEKFPMLYNFFQATSDYTICFPFF